MDYESCLWALKICKKEARKQGSKQGSKEARKEASKEASKEERKEGRNLINPAIGGTRMQDIAFNIHLDQRRGSDLIVAEAKGIEEELMVVWRDPHRDVVVDKVFPSKLCCQPVCCC